MADWKLDLMKRCSEKNIEIQQQGTKVIFICPREPSKADKLDIMGPLPMDFLSGVTVEFVSDPKPSTIQKIETLFKMGGLMAASLERDPLKRTMTVRASSIQKDKDPSKLFNDISDAIMKDGFADAWEITIDDDTRIYNRRVIEEISNRKILRDYSFTDDDILNLIIDLNTSLDKPVTAEELK